MNTKTASITGHRKTLPVLVLFALTNLVFICLYARFILGDAVYMYADIGNDSLSSSYPLLVLLSRLFHNGGFSTYAITDGLGTDITSLYLQYINPVKLLMLLFPTERLPEAILLSTFIQVNLLSFFGYRFFSRLLPADEAGRGCSSHPAAVIGALIWTFNGYVILWGQNYSFLTTIVMFTMIMAILQLFLQDSRLSRRLLFIPAVAVFLISNYYFLFMTGLFALVYVIFGAIYGKMPVRTFIRRFLELAGMTLGGVLMGAVSLMPILNSFLSSNRVSRLSGDSASGAASLFYDRPHLLTFLGRLFSVNTFGPGSGYTGAGNYYEAAVLTTSALFVLAAVYLLALKKTRLKTLVPLVLGMVLLCLPKASALLNMNASAQRWTFMLCFAEVIAITVFIRELAEMPQVRVLSVTVIAAPLLAIAALVLLYAGRRAGYFDLSPKPIALCMLAYGFYETLLLCYLIRRSRVLLGTVLTILVTIELILGNMMTVNDRMYLTKEAFHEAYYNDGSASAARALQRYDGTLWRAENDRQTDPNLYGITATADKMFANEGMVNDYNALSVYTSTLPASLTSYGSAYLSEQGRSNFFIIDFSDYYLFTLLGGRYVIGNRSNLFTDGADTSLWRDVTADVRRADTGTPDDAVFLENEQALPFGYLYTQQLSASSLEDLNALDRMRAVTAGYFLTDDLTEGGAEDSLDAGGSGTASVPVIPLVDADAVLTGAKTAYDLADHIVMTNDCRLSLEDGLLTVTAEGADPFIMIGMPDYDAGKALLLDLSCTRDGSTAIQLFMATKERPDFSASLCRDYTFTDDASELVMAMPEALTALRLDIMPGETVSFDEASLSVIDAVKDFAALSDSPVTDISLIREGIHTVYHAAVETDGNAVLCVPLPYSRSWQADVDGTAADIISINGGLIGIALESGSHTITMTYRVPGLTASAIVSLLTLIAYLILLIGQLRRERQVKAA